MLEFPMAKDVASVVICEACGDRVAEIVAEDRRALCSECHLGGAAGRKHFAKRSEIRSE